MLAGRHLQQAEVAANITWTESLFYFCDRNLFNPQPWCALLFCAGCIFQQPLSSRGLCFINAFHLCRQAEVHPVTVPLSCDRVRYLAFWKRLIFRASFGFFHRCLHSYFLAVSSLHRKCILRVIISHALK